MTQRTNENRHSLILIFIISVFILVIVGYFSYVNIVNGIFFESNCDKISGHLDGITSPSVGFNHIGKWLSNECWK